MNTALLLRHFPELKELPASRQEAILLEAHDRAYSSERKLEHWKRNVISLVWVTAVSLFIALVAGPALSLPRVATGAIIALVVLPAFMYVRHRQYLGLIRPEVEELLKKTGAR